MFKKSEVRTETVEEFLARGGKINQGIIRKENDYSNKEFEKNLHDFYQSREWKELRESVKKELTPICSVCGSEEDLHVDHINPVRHFWDKRLDRNNLQILCRECNLEKGSIINWNLDWHIKNKPYLAGERLIKERIKQNIEEEKKIKQENLTAFVGLELYQRMELNSCYTSYLNRCFKKKITPVSKTKFRFFIEMQMPKNIENTWFYSSEIKRYIKKNFEKIQ